MLEQGSVALPCVVQFTASGTGATGLTVTCTVYKWGGSSWSSVVTSQSATDVGEGFYSYQLTSGNNTGEGLYLFVFSTAGTADLKKVGAGWAVNKAGVEHLDADVTSRLAPTVAGRTLDVSSAGEAGVDWANVGSPTTTVGLTNTTVGIVTTYTGNTPQTGDAFARLGAPSGASVSADVAAVKSDTVATLTAVDTEVAAIKAKTDLIPAAPASTGDITGAQTAILAKLPAALVGGRIDASVGAMAADTITAAALAADAGTEIGTSVWASATRTLTSFGTLSTTTAAAVWDYLTSAWTTAGSAGAFLLAQLGGPTITIVSPVADDDDLNIVPGTAYTTAHGRQIAITFGASPDLTAAVVTLVIQTGETSVLSTTASVSGAGTASQVATFQLTAAQTALLTVIGDWAYRYQINATWAADSPTQPARLAEGTVDTTRKYLAS